VELPTTESLTLAAELWIKGHRDIMDNLAYAHAVKTQGYLMTLDEAFKSFLAENGYPLKFTVTHEDLEKIAQTSD
jgi:PIN domain nuclease of toxin-antitoxin system